MICRLCGKDRPLVKAHIIPEAFFRELRRNGTAPLLVTNTFGVHPKRTPIGIYDRELLCAACEARFGPSDSYAAEVLVNRRDELFKPITHDNKVIAYAADGIDQTLLSMFFVGLLWRAGATTQMFFTNFKLGPYQEIAKQVFLGAAPEQAHIFATVLARWTASKKWRDLTTAMMNPFAERWDGVNAYRLYIGEHVAHVKVDKRSYTEPLKSLQIGNQKMLFVTTRDLDNSNELRVMKMVAEATPIKQASDQSERK